jgi:hypothetical protein
LPAIGSTAKQPAPFHSLKLKYKLAVQGFGRREQSQIIGICIGRPAPAARRANKKLSSDSRFPLSTEFHFLYTGTARLSLIRTPLLANSFIFAIARIGFDNVLFSIKVQKENYVSKTRV